MILKSRSGIADPLSSSSLSPPLPRPSVRITRQFHRNGFVMKTALPAAIAACLLSGCAQSLINSSAMEKRVVQQFADAVTEENESALRKITSSRFEEKAMSSDDALTDLRVVHLPTGKLSVVEVKETNKNLREVIVKEESGGKYQFHLVHDAGKEQWVVDDVLIRQNKKGTRTSKSTTEVMDLLMTLRTFLKVWEQGSRDEILALASPDLTRSLQDLPDNWLKALTSRTASVYEEGMARKPEANLTDEDAVVKLPARNGHLMMKIVRSDDGWLVDDVEIHNHRSDDHSGSVRRQADAINTITAFLTAYGKQDRERLKQLTGQRLFDDSLRFADLSMVRLPQPTATSTEFDIRVYESRLTFMIPAGNEVLRLDLKQAEKASSAVAASDSNRFIVEEVTLYNRGSQKQRSLSAVFTAPTRASMFLKGLANRDHTVLTQMSTTGFARGTWQRVDPQTLSKIAIPDLYAEGLELVDAHTVAERTELQFRNSTGMLLSCRMHDQNGSLKIDDVQYPNMKGQVSSLRTQLELRIPILEFADAWQRKDMQALQKSCSSDFNRLVWSHLKSVPTRFSTLAGDLESPIVGTQVTQERATVRLADKQTGRQVMAKLITEHDFWVVDEVRLEEAPGQVVGIREKLRSQIAARLLSGSYSMVHSPEGNDRVVPIEASPTRLQDNIRQASAQFPEDETSGNVNHAIYHRYPDEADAKSKGTPVTPAILTKEHPQSELADDRTRKGNVFTADYRVDSPAGSDAKTVSGMTVFGPQATEVAATLDNPAAVNKLSLTTPIDMTEEDSPSAKLSTPKSPPANSPTVGGNSDQQQQADTEADSNFMYFGPDRDVLKAKPVKSSGTALTEPADAPISIE